RLHQSGGRDRGSRQRREGVVRLAGCARSRSAGDGLVRGQDLGRGEGGDRAAQQGRARQRGLCADGLLPDLPGLAQERERRGQGAAAVLLGRRQGRLTPRRCAAQRRCGSRAFTPVFAGLKGVTPVFAGYAATGDTLAPMTCRDRDARFMNRRAFLKSVAGAGVLTVADVLATPAISQRAAARVLRFVPQADLANFDPIWNTQYVVRNGAALVWDMLYGVDDKLQPRRQMVESEDVSSDGLVWTFRLRPGLKFHDGEPVRAKDVVASLARWQARDNMALMTKQIEQELVAVDDRTFRWVLKKPYPKLLVALGKVGTPSCFIMPARVAATDPFKPIGEYVGSGPMRFVRDEWVPGARAVFERFADYAPRQEPNSWLSGGKHMLLDRIEWIVMPDPATASAALQNGEVDWWETPIADLVAVLKRNRNVVVDIADPLGNIGSFRMNHLHPPFNDVRARRAILTAMSQEDYMRAVVGDDALWKP